MGLKCGIVGLPNVGKSTLFNAISNNKAEAANFPFCTIEPNIGVVNVPDKRLEKLTELVNPLRVQPATVEIVDIAGLVKGASKGEGLGNQFLANIRETDAILHVLRCFDNDNIVHVDGSINPVRDKETIDIELQLKDLDTVDLIPMHPCDQQEHRARFPGLIHMHCYINGCSGGQPPDRKIKNHMFIKRHGLFLQDNRMRHRSFTLFFFILFQDQAFHITYNMTGNILAGHFLNAFQARRCIDLQYEWTPI